MQKIPNRISRILVPLVFTGCLAGAGALMYARYVLGLPMVFIRDSEGVLRQKTRMEALEERAADAEKKLAAAPDDKRLQFLAALAVKELFLEREKVKALHALEGKSGSALEKPLKDEDLK
jgi:hypothetical protein